MAGKRWDSFFMDADQPLAERIQRAAFSLVMLVVLVIGAASLGISLLEIPAAEEDEHRYTLRIIGERLGGSFTNRIHNLEALSESSLVTTALTDSADREAYLKPFLEGRDRKDGADDILLLDYRGRPLAGQLNLEFPATSKDAAISAALKERRPQFVLHPEQPVLLAAYPVLFPYTQDAIGVLVSAFDLRQAFLGEITSLVDGHGITLLHGERVLTRFPAAVTDGHFPLRYAVPVLRSDRMPHLELEMYSTDYQWMMPLATRMVVYGFLALFFGFLVWQLSGRLAVSLTRRLNRLAVACAGVAAGNPLVLGEDRSSDEIGLLSRTLRRAITGYEQMQSNLERLVAQKTQALNESVERYRQAFENNSAIKLIIDPRNGRIVDANEAACSFYGYSHNRLLSLGIGDLNVLAEVDVALQMAEAATGRGYYATFKHRLASGELRDVEVYSGPVTIGGRQLLHSIIHDITERVRTEVALRQAEEKYRSVLENIREVVFQTDSDGRWTYLNAAWLEITGFGVDESLGCPVFDYVFAEDREACEAMFRCLMSAEKQYSRQEIRCRHKDGGIRRVEIFARRLSDGEGHFVGAAGSLADVTERRAAEARLRLSASVFEHCHEGIMLTDSEGRILDVNAAFSRITGYERGEVIGRSPSLLKSGQHSPDFYQQLWAALAEKAFWQGEVWNRRKNGEVHPDLLTVSAVRDENGRISHYVGVFAAISRVRQDEEQCWK